MSNKEKEIKQFMEKYNLTKEEATQLWLEDNGIVENAEIEEMTQKAKSVKRYEKSDKKRKQSTKERKVDTEKGAILKTLKPVLKEFGATNIIQETETALHFKINETDFTLKLTRHKSKK